MLMAQDRGTYHVLSSFHFLLTTYNFRTLSIAEDIWLFLAPHKYLIVHSPLGKGPVGGPNAHLMSSSALPWAHWHLVSGISPCSHSFCDTWVFPFLPVLDSVEIIPITVALSMKKTQICSMHPTLQTSHRCRSDFDIANASGEIVREIITLDMSQRGCVRI